VWRRQRIRHSVGWDSSVCLFVCHRCRLGPGPFAALPSSAGTRGFRAPFHVRFVSTHSIQSATKSARTLYGARPTRVLRTLAPPNARIRLLHVVHCLPMFACHDHAHVSAAPNARIRLLSSLTSLEQTCGKNRAQICSGQADGVQESTQRTRRRAVCYARRAHHPTPISDYRVGKGRCL
jgi:hypothetical protein